MPGQTVRNNRYDLLRASYDIAFASLCHARREFEVGGGDGLMEKDFRRLEKSCDVWQMVYTRARNDLASCIMERRYTARHSRVSHGRLIVGSPANRSIIPQETGA